MTAYIDDPVFWGLVAGISVAAAFAISTHRKSRRASRDKAALEQRNEALEKRFTESVEEAKNRAEDGTRTALKTAMRTLQGLANEQQIAISGLQRKYGDQHILQDLLEIDHMNSQFGRRAQSIAVLCEGWLGRHRSVASVYDVARSAKGRVRHFTRIEIRSQTSFAVISQAVEPVALALAELLDNATSYSAPETTIDINIRSVPKGVCIVIDDAGVGMNEEEKTRAAELLTNPVSGVTGLGNPPQFGFAVMGVLAARYGFSVSVDSSSPYGGVRAVVLLPQELLTSMPEPDSAAHAPGAPGHHLSTPPAVAPGPSPAQPVTSAAAHMPRAVPQAGPHTGPPPGPHAGPHSSPPPGPPPGFHAAPGGGHPGRHAAPPPGPRAVPDPAPRTPAPERDAGPPAAAAPEPRATTRGGLPKRRRRNPMTIVGQGPEGGEAPARSNEETASIMGAFQRGTQSGRTAETDREGHEFL